MTRHRVLQDVRNVSRRGDIVRSASIDGRHRLRITTTNRRRVDDDFYAELALVFIARIAQGRLARSSRFSVQNAKRYPGLCVDIGRGK